MKKPTILQMLSLEYFCLFSKNSLLFLTTFVTTNPVTHKNKNRFLSHAFAMVGILFFMTQLSFGQVGKAFSARLTGGNIRIKGDVIFVGNSMMSTTTYPNLAGGVPDPRNVLPVFSPSDPNGTPTNLAALTAEANKNFNIAVNNNGLNQEYTDIDSDPTTFASSSAELKINQSCKRIVYAGLYWTAIYPYERSTNSGSDTQGTARKTDWNQIKFKLPGAANYVDIIADNAADPVGDEDDIIYDSNSAGTKLPNTPYACYKNVTKMIQNLTDPNGNYFAANIRAAKGKKGSGSMAGWTLVIIYESPTLPSRYISTFDGFVGITSALKNIDFTVNGFRTLPAPLPVRATIGVAAQEGESKLFGDDLLIKANSRPTFTFVNNSRNPLNNVFNSSITVPTTTTPFSANVDTRVPNSLNTLGFDMDLINVNNPNNGVIPNGETGATYRLTSTSDTYAAYVTTFAVDVIEPEIVLTKVVKNSAGVDIGNQNVTLGDYLNYEIGFRNVGNDDADQFTIKDVLPINILFDPNTIVIPNGSGITYTYTPATRTLIFTVPNNIVKINGNQWIIKFGVQVVPNCNDLSDACSDRIQNQAFATYRGITNPSIITDDPSISVFGNCNLAVAAPTNFLVGVDGCKYTKKYQLCGTSVAISAANGYNTYQWSSSPFVNGVATGPIIGTTQTITVTNVGTYYVRNTALAPCISIDETVTVEPFGTTVVNPVVPFASEVVTCPNNGKSLPNIYLCGANAKKYIRTGVTDTTDIVWEKSSCVLVPNTLCADETNTCTWTQVATGPDFNVGDQGQYRITLRYANGCFNRYFFNVYENNLTPTATSRDIICTTNGEIVVGTPAAGSGYEYSLDGTTYQASNILPVTTPNIYTVYIRSTANVANACVFTIPGIQIRKRDFTVTTTINNPLCNGGKGSVKLAANDVRAQYFFEIFNASGVSVSKVGPVIPNDYTFPNLNPGAYTVTVKTEDGCDYTGTVTLVEPDVLTATAAITKALTCENGEITVTPVGGTGPFTYFVNSATDFQGSPIIDVATPGGVYNIRVVDFNNCEFTLAPITINATPKPVFTVAKTDVLCYGANSGEIKFNVTNANGYTLAYSIDNGATYLANGTFSSLAIGTYKPILKYTLGGVDCFETQPDIIITEPAAALTASAGVSELAGCGPAREGKVRITNPQGGTPFAGPNLYEFSFDNQATWTTVNDAYKAPGMYTLYVRDANGCIFSAPVILDPEPAEPVIDATPQIDFNCDGSATSTVTVANPPNTSYTFEYYLDNVKNTNVPSNVFLNVSSGSHSIRVDYKLNSVSTFSNLLFEDFGRGDDTKSPGINSAYCWEKQDNVVDCIRPNDWHPWLMNDGDYVVTKALLPDHFNDFQWFLPSDHTKVLNNTPAITDGRFLAVNIGDKIPPGAVLYSKTINDIIPNQPINVSLYMVNLLKQTNNLPSPQLTVRLTKGGSVVASQVMPSIPRDEVWHSTTDLAGGTVFTLNPGNNTSLEFEIISNSTVIDGNDLAIDDISVYQLPKTCISSKSFPLTIDPGKAFTAQITGQKNVTCNGLTNGEFTISATNFDTTTGYQYSTDNGATWSVALFASPVTVSNLAGNLYKVIVRPVGSAVAACAKPFDVTISAPTAVTLSASVTKLVTCATGATITAIGSGGTPAYEYELRQSNGTTVVTAFNNNGGIFTNVPAGSYTVFMRDANGCVNPTGVAVPVNAVPTLSATLAASTDYCYTTANPATLDVTVTGGVGPFTYKLNSNAAIASAATSYSFTNVAPGTHTIVVTDSNNCTATISSIVIAPQLGFTVSLINDLTCLADASIGNPVVSNGNGGPYTYAVSYNSGTPTPVTAFPYTATLAGTYVFTIYDSKSCPATSNTITVTAKTTPVASPSETDITCNNANDGTITITASAGFTSAYTYAIKLSTAPTYTTQTTNTFTGLAAGVYDVKVIDSKGCESAVVQVTIANPTPIAANATVTTTFSCSPTNTKQAATITVAPTGGTGGYTYSYNNGTSFGSSATLTVNDNGTTQTIRIIVKDGNGCLSPMQQIDLAPLNPPTDLMFANAAVTCTATTTTVNVTATNGVGALTFLITGTNSGTAASNFGPITTSGSSVAANFPNLLPGNYTFRVTDANGCYYTESHTVAAVIPIAIAPNTTSDVLCQGGNTGSGTYTVSGNAGAYTFTVIAGAIPPASLIQSGNVLTLSNATAGTYTVRVRDTTTGCEADGTITINEPAAPLDITNAVATNFNCNNDNAQITVTATGGTAAYGYAAVPAVPVTVPSTFASSNVVTVDTNNGTILNWVVFVRDANGCTTSRSVTIVGDPAPAAPVVNVLNQCSATGSGFTITVTPVTGPLGPYTYGISGATGAFQAANTFNVAPGTYTVLVRDVNGCISAGTAVTVSAQLTASAAVTKTLDCSGSPDAVISGTINGGKAPFTVVVTSGTGPGTIAQPTTNTFTYTTAIASAYTFTITDANGCQTTTSATVSPITNPSVAPTPTQVSCNGGTDGSVTLVGSGGSGGYTYSNDNVNFVPSGLFTSLAASATPYTFYVKDSKGCTGSVAVTITEPTALLVSASATAFSCSATNVPQSAVVTIAVPTTGTSPYYYSFNGGAYSNTIRTLTVNDNGTTNQPINYSVRDGNGCITAGAAITINKLNPPTIATITHTPIYCVPASSTTSTVTVPVTAGTGVGTLTYTITSPAAATTNTTGATNGIFTGLTAGTYVFRVTDANGCYATKSHTVPALTSIAVTATKLTDVDCFGNTTGSIRYNVSGFSGTYSYSVNGATAVTGQILTPFTLSNLGANTYSVVFTDAITGCTVPTSVIITQPAAALALNLVSNKNANCNVATARVEVSASNGTPNYTYAFMQDGVAPLPANYTASAIGNLNPLTDLNWDVWVKDSKGCTVKLDVLIATDPTPTVTASATGQCLGVGTFTITANNTTPAAGIVNPITYSLNGGTFQSGDTFTITASGDYIIRMRDGNGCIVTATTITVVPQLTLNAVLNKDITCNPAPTAAQITLTPTGGSGTFTYESKEALGVFTAMASNIFTTNTAGSYTFRVTDTVTGCTYTTTVAITVTTPVNPVIDDVALPGNIGVTQTAFINCNGDDTAAIAIAIDNTKGQSPFVFNVQRTAPTTQNYGTQTSGLSAGDYLVTVTDAKGCTDIETITITEPTPITFVRTVTPITCNTVTGQSLGSITINSVTGGTPNYTYHVTGVNGLYDKKFTNQTGGIAVFDVVDFGLYQIIITDANGCAVFENNILIASPPSDLDISVVPVGPTCAGLGSAEISIGALSSITGTGPFHFAVYSPGLTYTGPTTLPWYDEDAIGSKKTTIPNLIPGVIYTFIVHDSVTGCYYFETANVPIPTNSTITVNPLTPNNITCKGAADGNVTFTMNHIYGAATPVTYQIYNSQSVTAVGTAVATTIPASGSLVINNFGTLPFGNYFVLVTETAGAPNAGCSISSAPFDITESAIDLTITANVIKNSNCIDLGIITGQAKDGTAPYTYQVVPTGAPVVATDWVSTNTFTRAGSLVGIDYDVHTKDAYGCDKFATVKVFQDALPTITAPTPICYNGTPFTIDLSTVSSATILPATYKVVPSTSSGTIAYQNVATFTFNAADTYRLFIKDGNGCEAFVDYVVRPQLQLSPLLTKELDCNLPTPNATVTVTASGGAGAGSYTYTITAGPVTNTTGVTTGIFTDLDAGNYTFTVNDGACSATATFTIDPLVPIVPTATVSIPLCVGDNANVEINATGGTGNYEYKKGLGGTYVSTNIFTQTALEGTVTYYVKDSNDCEFTVVATVVDPTALGVPTIAVTPLTCGTGNIPNGATIIVTASGGAGGFEYSFDNGASYSSSNSITNAIAGTYEIIVKDANGCETAMQSIDIDALIPPTNMDIAGTPIYCVQQGLGDLTSTVTINTVTNGIAPFTYQIISPIANMIDNGTNAVFAGLAPDTYVFQITDANGCTYQESYTVAPVTPIAIVGAVINDISCDVANGTTNNGSASFTVTGFSASGNYSIAVTSVPAALPFTPTAAADVITLTGLSAGTYTVTVTDTTTGCTEDDTVTITLPAPIVFTATPTKVFCSQDISTITVSAVAGGTGTYTYAVQLGGTVTPPSVGSYSTSSVLTVDTNLTALSWDVYVKDANGCIAMQNVVITNNALPTIVAPAAQCYVGTSLTTDLNTVTTTYNGTKSYTVNGSVSTANPIFTAPGLYVLGIKDDNGCEAFVNYTIQPQLLANAVLTKDLYCAAPVNATIEVTITDGVAPYNYQMLLNGAPSGGPTPVAVSTFTASVPTAGSYTFVITDSNAATCTVTSNAVVVTTPAIPTFTEVHTNVTCDAGSDGTITVTPANGVAPYTFVLTGAGANTTGATTGIYTGLPAGSYTVVVTDAKGCTSVAVPAIPITAPAVVSATISVTTGLTCGAGNATQAATVTAQGFGGNGTYQYNFNNQGFTANNTFVTNIAGSVNVIVKDGNGCTFTTAVSTNVAPLNPPTDMNISGTPIYCVQQGLGDVTSTVTVTTINGVGTLTYAILSPATATGNTSGATSGIFTLLAPDTYTFQVTDTNGCTYQESFTVAPVTNITVAASASTNVTCFGFANGAATFDVANFGGTYNYTFDGAPTTNVSTAQLTFTNLTPVLHTLIVTDAITGCQATATVTISQPAAALDFTTTATNINCNKDEATITVTAIGGTPTYKYAVLQSPSSAPALTAYGLSNLLTVDTNGGATMVWDVYVIDANGCPLDKPQTIVLDANPVITSANHTACVSATGTYDITVIATGFNPSSFQYSADGSNYQTGNVITVNASGPYTIYVKDANGCVSVGFPITILDPLILTPTVTTPVSCANGDGVIAVNTTGGSNILANYQYKIDSGSYPMTTPFTGLAFGTHRVYVQDIATGCEVFADIDLQQATPITGFALAKTEVTCNGGSDGTITATMTTPAAGVNDNPVYTYTLTGTSITGAAVNVGPQTSPLFSGLPASDLAGYTVVVTSARGCTATDTKTIVQPAIITVPAPTVVPFACTSGNTGNLATITVIGVTGGSGTYLNYEFIKNGTSVYLGPNNTYTEANLSGGSYIVKVYDSKGCMGTTSAPIIINPYIQLDQVNVNVTRVITCTNLEDIAVSVSAIGGTPANLQFTIQDVTYDNSVPPIATKGAVYNLPPVSIVGGVATFTNLPVGNYEITVRNLDTNCEIIGVHYVNEPNTFDLTIDNVVDVTCLNDTNGSARVTLIDRVPTPIDNAGPFTYTVTGPVPSTGTAATAGPINLTNLAAGTYTITAVLTNTPFCTVSKNFTIAGPNAALVIGETHTEITCVTANNDGSISATATGGWPGGYEFQLERGATVVTPWSATSSFNALTAGTYTVKVRDPKGCEVFTTVLLNNPTPIAFTATPSTTLLTCKGNTNATITVSLPTGGQGSNYLYTLNTTSATPVISSGPQANNVFTNLGAGTYTVTVTDGWGCGTTSAPIVIAEPTEVIASLVLASSATCTVQSRLTLSATGGTAPYSYSTTANFAVVAGTFASATTFAVAPGTYRFYVRDANGCIATVSNDIQVDPLPTLTVAVDIVNAKINCNGDTSGVIVAVATGGLGNYVYTLLNGSGTPIVPAPTQLTPGRFTNLAAGAYQVRVDSQDCNVTSTGVITITQPLLPVTASAVATPVTCNGAANGIITVTASGGTGAIKYAIEPRSDQFFDTGVFDELAPGTYKIIVQDENGCYVIVSETITEPQPIFVNTVAGSEVQELCFGDNNAAFDVNITGGVMPYSVTLDNINGTYVTGALAQNVFNFAGLTGGDHTVYIKDANGCTAEWLVALDPSVNLDPKASVAYGCDNNSPSNTVTVTVDTSITNLADVDYALDGSTVFQASNIFRNVAAGFHTITARHTNGCEKITAQFEVLGFTPLALTLADGGLNEIVATATGGAGNYQYSFDGGNTFDTNNKLIYYKSGDYTVIVRDANGCEATATRYFEFIDIKIPNVFTPNGDGNNDTWTPTNTINYKDLTINIFDRYGRKVDTLREGQGWDGKYNGLELPTGDYWYILKLKNVQDDREFVGHFTLMR